MFSSTPTRGGRTFLIDVCPKVIQCVERYSLDFSRLVCVTTDGDPATIGQKKDATSLLVRHCEAAGHTQPIQKMHCIIHQEALRAKSANLKYYGISPQALNWVHSFLTNRTQQVLLEGNMSSSINDTSGVPQGSVLGPLLFLIYINDLPDYIQNNSTVQLFADDTIIYHPINNQQDSIALQEDLDSLQRWESDWLMHFHPQKCQTMHITNKRNIIQSTYTIHNHKLQTTDTAKYLGIHIHSTLNWNTHITKTAQRANTTSAFLHRNIRTCPRKTKHLAYTALVRPILEYASIIWDPHTASNINKLETVQRRSARHIMHNYSRHASVTTMLQHLDLPTLQQRHQHSKIIMLYRITHKLASIPTATYIAPCIRNTQH